MIYYIALLVNRFAAYFTVLAFHGERSLQREGRSEMANPTKMPGTQIYVSGISSSILLKAFCLLINTSNDVMLMDACVSINIRTVNKPLAALAPLKYDHTYPLATYKAP